MDMKGGDGCLDLTTFKFVYSILIIFFLLRRVEFIILHCSNSNVLLQTTNYWKIDIFYMDNICPCNIRDTLIITCDMIDLG